MQCPRCANEDVRVFRTNRGVKSNGKQSDTTDTRKVVCDECGLIFVTESTIIGIIVYHERYKRNKVVSVDEFKRTV